MFKDKGTYIVIVLSILLENQENRDVSRAKSSTQDNVQET